uniref:hypothetical protein n=1 Tax=Amycolatopsis sp. CA-151526 TaxID=3239921 RepID=UPI003F49772F
MMDIAEAPPDTEHDQARAAAVLARLSQPVPIEQALAGPPGPLVLAEHDVKGEPLNGENA